MSDPFHIGVRVGDRLRYCYSMPGPDMDDLTVVAIHHDKIVCHSDFLDSEIAIRPDYEYNGGSIRIGQWVRA